MSRPHATPPSIPPPKPHCGLHLRTTYKRQQNSTTVAMLQRGTTANISIFWQNCNKVCRRKEGIENFPPRFLYAWLWVAIRIKCSPNFLRRAAWSWLLSVKMTMDRTREQSVQTRYTYSTLNKAAGVNEKSIGTTAVQSSSTPHCLDNEVKLVVGDRTKWAH